jgi:hypothetical protein
MNVLPTTPHGSADRALSAADAASGPANILADYVAQSDFAQTHRISPRTVARYRNAGMPWIMWGGEIYIHIEGAATWLKGRIRHSNQRRAA